MLTFEQMILLEKPFAVSEHDFVRGNVYLKKSAIRKRLNAVDAGWSNTEPQLVSFSDDVIVLRGGLTVGGVTRYALGRGIVGRFRKDYQTRQVTELSGFDLAREITKAYKSADSDLLPRCAVLFGVGSYLKDIPRQEGKSTVTNPQQLEAWIRTLTNGQQPERRPSPFGERR